jgi:hypothetical protein
MTDEIRNLPFDQLRALHLEIGALLAQKRSEALAALEEQSAVLGFTANDFAPPKKKRGRKSREPEGSEAQF